MTHTVSTLPSVEIFSSITVLTERSEGKKYGDDKKRRTPDIKNRKKGSS